MSIFHYNLEVHLGEVAKHAVELECVKQKLDSHKRTVADILRSVREELGFAYKAAAGDDQYDMKLSLSQKNTWVESFCKTEPDVLAYVSLSRTCWKRDPSSSLIVAAPMSEKELTIAHAVKTKIVELGFKLPYPWINSGNVVVWQLVM